MADIVHHDHADREDASSTALMLVLLVAILAIGAILFLAFSGAFGNLNRAGTGTPGTNIDLDGEVNVPDFGAPNTNVAPTAP